jgi:V/A-type H+-transporting ATPase subunit E
MENGNGAEKLITSILEEARKAAERISERAADRVEEVKRKLEEDRAVLNEEFTKKAQALREDTLAKARTNAELESRKKLLEKKRGLIDEAYASAESAVRALEGEKREALLRALIARECEGGEIIRPAEKDRALVEKLVSASDKGLKLGENAEGLGDGFVLEGSNYYKDCSFTALMEEVRQETSADTVKKLFE